TTAASAADAAATPTAATTPAAAATAAGTSAAIAGQQPAKRPPCGGRSLPPTVISYFCLTCVSVNALLGGYGYSSQPVKAAMSAFGPKRTSLVALHMSAFGGKADMPMATQPSSS